MTNLIMIMWLFGHRADREKSSNIFIYTLYGSRYRWQEYNFQYSQIMTTADFCGWSQTSFRVLLLLTSIVLLEQISILLSPHFVLIIHWWNSFRSHGIQFLNHIYSGEEGERVFNCCGTIVRSQEQGIGNTIRHTNTHCISNLEDLFNELFISSSNTSTFMLAVKLSD